MTENELTGLDKEYFDAALTTWREYEKDNGKLYILKTLSEVGGVVSKSPHGKDTFYQYKNGDGDTVVLGKTHFDCE